MKTKIVYRENEIELKLDYIPNTRTAGDLIDIYERALNDVEYALLTVDRYNAGIYIQSSISMQRLLLTISEKPDCGGNTLLFRVEDIVTKTPKELLALIFQIIVSHKEEDGLNKELVLFFELN